MTPSERRASGWLASIFALRMFGLFSLLPIFAIYAKDLRGGDSVYVMALTLSIYGIGEALMQIAFSPAAESPACATRPAKILALRGEKKSAA